MQDIIREILRRVGAAKILLESSVASGTHIHSFEAYQRLVGKREGLSETLDIINDILTEDDEKDT